MITAEEARALSPNPGVEAHLECIEKLIRENAADPDRQRFIYYKLDTLQPPMYADILTLCHALRRLRYRADVVRMRGGDERLFIDWS